MLVLFYQLCQLSETVLFTKKYYTVCHLAGENGRAVRALFLLLFTYDIIPVEEKNKKTVIAKSYKRLRYTCISVGTGLVECS